MVTRVSLVDSPIVHVAGRGTAIVQGRAIAPVKTLCGRVLRGEIVQRGPRLTCRDCAYAHWGRRVDLADMAEHGLYDGPGA